METEYNKKIIERLKQMPKFYLGQSVISPDGEGVIVGLNMDFNGLYVSEETSKATVWYSTDESKNGWVNRVYYLTELSQPELKAVKTAMDLILELKEQIPFAFPKHLFPYLVELCEVYHNQFSQPKEEQPEKIVSELPSDKEYLESLQSEILFHCVEKDKLEKQLDFEKENANQFAKKSDEYRNVITRQSKEIESLTKELEQAKVLLRESKKTIQWCVDNLHLPHTSDHFNVPMGTISLIEQNLKK